MNMITGYLAPNEGTVVIDGHDIMEEPEEAKRCIGYLPEIPPLYPEMTVREYLDFVSELKSIPKAHRAEEVDRVLEEVRIADMERRLIRNLSKGYCQRVGLAQAILGNPKILILDEPTVGLDPKQIIEIRELMKNLGKKHTVLLSSHILTEVSAVCDYVMILSHGKNGGQRYSGESQPPDPGIQYSGSDGKRSHGNHCLRCGNAAGDPGCSISDVRGKGLCGRENKNESGSGYPGSGIL